LRCAAHPDSGIREIKLYASPGAQALAPVARVRGFGVLAMTQADYLSLVDFTGRLIRPDKCGAITGRAPAVLAQLG